MNYNTELRGFTLTPNCALQKLRLESFVSEKSQSAYQYLLTLAPVERSCHTFFYTEITTHTYFFTTPSSSVSIFYLCHTVQQRENGSLSAVLCPLFINYRHCMKGNNCSQSEVSSIKLGGRNYFPSSHSNTGTVYSAVITVVFVAVTRR